MDNANLKKAGLKITSPRMKILHILEKAKEHHMSAEDIFKILSDANEDIGLATIYRALAQFEEAGLVVRHHFSEGHSVYELDHGTHHDHLVCVKCGLVKEFVDDDIERRQEEVAKREGFVITDHSLNIYGICGRCHNQ